MNAHSVISIQLNKARVVAILTPHFRRAPLLFLALCGAVLRGSSVGLGYFRMVRSGTIAVAKNCLSPRLPHPNQSSTSLNLIPTFPLFNLYLRASLRAS